MAFQRRGFGFGASRPKSGSAATQSVAGILQFGRTAKILTPCSPDSTLACSCVLTCGIKSSRATAARKGLWLPNGVRLSCGALNRNSFHNLRAALSGCYSKAVRISVIVSDKELSLTIVAVNDL